MSLKIPGVGKKITKFEYSAVSDSAGNVIISISYCGKSNRRRYKFFELRCDERFKTPEEIVKTVLGCLAGAKYGKSVKIREDKDRDYVFIGDHQFTGNALSQK